MDIKIRECNLEPQLIGVKGPGVECQVFNTDHMMESADTVVVVGSRVQDSDEGMNRWCLA